MSNRILIIDDDVELAEYIASFLTNNGYQVNAHHTGRGVAQEIEKAQPDLILLDLMLPEVDGLTVCKQIRDKFAGSIIMLTALSDDIDEVTGLELGADDYIAKPVKPRVLLAHIRAQLRRLNLNYEKSKHEIGEICINAMEQSVTVQGKCIFLTSAEFELFDILAQHRGQVMSRDILHKKIYGLEHDGVDRSIDIRVSRLRKKCSEGLNDKVIIKTVRSQGYLLCE